MENTTIEIGNTTTVELDFIAGSTAIHLSKPSQPNLMNLFEEQLASLEKVTVCLSGGLDSQFSANLAKKFCKDVNAVCFRFMWDDNVINSDDVVTAQQFADKIDLELHYEDIDIKEHLTNASAEYTRKYTTVSPQISVQLAAIKKSKFNDRTLMLGGDAPTVAVTKHFDQVYLQRKTYYNEDGKTTGTNTSAPNFYYAFSAPFSILEQTHGLHIIKDPFLLTPEILYAGYYQNKYVIESFGEVMLVKNNAKTNADKYKENYYKSFEDFEYVFPIAKRTGFENLKLHLASVTGNFDEFDEKYRQPLYSVAQECTWFNPLLFNKGRIVAASTKAKVFFPDKESVELEDIILNSVREIEPSACNIYNFDW
jgi:hypothetical protein